MPWSISVKTAGLVGQSKRHPAAGTVDERDKQAEREQQHHRQSGDPIFRLRLLALFLVNPCHRSPVNAGHPAFSRPCAGQSENRIPSDLGLPAPGTHTLHRK